MRRAARAPSRRRRVVQVGLHSAGVQEPYAPSGVDLDEELEQADTAAMRQQAAHVLHHWHHPLAQPPLHLLVDAIIKAVQVAVVQRAVKRRRALVDRLGRVRQLVHVLPVLDVNVGGRREHEQVLQ